MDNDPQFRTADGSALRMWRDTAKNKHLSETHGRPIYDDVIFVEVIAPGSSGSCPVFELERVFAPEMNHPEPLRGVKYDEYQEQVKLFKQREETGDDGKLAGTPLKEWGEISRTMAASLREAKIFTVEALAALPDSRLNAVGPDGRTWRTKAQVYLDSTKDASVATALAGKLEEAQATIDRQAQETKALAEQVAALQAQIAQASQTRQEAPQAPAATPAAQTPPSAPQAAPSAATEVVPKAKAKATQNNPAAPVAAAGDALLPAATTVPGLGDII